MLIEGPPPPAPLFEGPLYVSGKRRPGPSRWGFDPYAPNLEPADLNRELRKMPRCNVIAVEFWGARETLEACNRAIPEMCLRYVPRHGRLTDDPRTEVREFNRRDRRAVAQRLNRWAAARANKVTGLVAKFTATGGVQQLYSLEEIAKAVGARCVGQLSRIISDGCAAGHYGRSQKHEADERGWKPHRAALVLLPKFWRACGAEDARQAEIRKADALRRLKTQHTQSRAGQLANRPPAAPAVAQLVGQLAGEVGRATKESVRYPDPAWPKREKPPP